MAMHLIKCLYCHKEVSKPKKTYKYCCRSCQSYHLAALKISCQKPKTGEDRICEECGKIYYLPVHRIKKNESRFCSRKCQGKMHVKERPYMQFEKTNFSYKYYKTIKVNGKWVRLHRYMMEQHLGRKLETWEHVHHINGDHLDNRLQNLQVLSNSDHQKLECKSRKRKKKLID